MTTPSEIDHEQCPDCLQLHSLSELQLRCIECDSVRCQFCLIRIETRWYCFDCKENADGRARDVEG